MFTRLFHISKWQHYRRLGRIWRWMHSFCSTKFGTSNLTIFRHFSLPLLFANKHCTLHTQLCCYLRFFDNFCPILTFTLLSCTHNVIENFRKPGFFRIFPNEVRTALQVWQVSILRWASRIAAKTAPFQVFRVFLTRKITAKTIAFCKFANS